MLQLLNKTPFIGALSVFPDENAVDSLYIMIKGTFDIGQNIDVSENQSPLTEADLYYGEPGESSLKYPSDYHTGKTATDIILLGSACALEQQTTKALDVGLNFGHIQKTVRVFGERYWDKGQISTPQPFETMRLRYENAFGGQDIIDGVLRSAETRNPVGKGFKGEKSTEHMDGTPLPNLENPHQAITQISSSPQPACFAALAPNWTPRAEYVGTYDDDWEQTRAPFLPFDYSPKFMNSAAHELVYPGYINGTEPVRISGMHPLGTLEFLLPSIDLFGSANISGKKHTFGFVAETVILEPNQLQFTVCWRAKLTCGKKLAQVDHISVRLKK